MSTLDTVDPATVAHRRPRGRRWALGLAAATVVALPAAAVAGPGNVQGPDRISGPSSLRACPSGGVFTTDREMEPHLAVDPADPAHLIAVWQQDRTPNQGGGGARSIRAGVSTDGGLTWTNHDVAGLNVCTGGSDDAPLSDPVVSIDAAGRGYLITNRANRIAANIPAAVLLATSEPNTGGREWSTQTLAESACVQPGAAFCLERPFVAADPVTAGRAYAVWVDIVTRQTMFAVATPDAAGRPQFGPPQQLTTTTDAIPTNELVLPGAAHQQRDVILDVVSTGAVPIGGQSQVRVLRGHRQGATVQWDTTPVFQRTFPALPLAQAPGALPGTNLDRVVATNDATVAVGRDGTVFLAWPQHPADAQPGQHRSQIWLTTSTDQGQTWSTPRVVLDRPYLLFTTELAVSRDDTLALTFYVDRGGDAEHWAVDYRLAHAHDGDTAWAERTLSTFNMHATASASGPSGREYRVGEYQGLVGAPRGFVSVFVQGTTDMDNVTDTFAARINPRP